MKIVRFLKPAEQEMLNAARYYELQSPSLGEDFLVKIESAIHDIAENPERWPIIHSYTRRRMIHRFPYALLYRIDPEEVVILAVSHLRRNPIYWLERM